MEADFPSNNPDGKMADLDLKVWICKEDSHMLNTSPRLDLQLDVAPFVTDYMIKMK